MAVPVTMKRDALMDLNIKIDKLSRNHYWADLVRLERTGGWFRCKGKPAHCLCNFAHIEKSLGVSLQGNGKLLWSRKYGDDR